MVRHDRVRTARLRRDPRCGLFVVDPQFQWLGIDADVAILDGLDAAGQNLRLFRLMQGKPTGPLSWFGGEHDEEAFLDLMKQEDRLIYEFTPVRVYGLVM